MNEQWNFHRVPFATKAEINCNSNKYHGELVSIFPGALVNGKGNMPLEKGRRCELLLHLLGSEITLQFEIDIIYSHKNKSCLKFFNEDIETASPFR